MKITKLSLIALLSSASMLFAQSNEDRSRAQWIDSTNRAQVFLKQVIPQFGSASVAKSDTGAQRPVRLNKSGISTYLGYDVKMVYRSNPLASAGKLKQLATGVWTHTFLVVLDSAYLISGFCGYSLHWW